MSFKRAGDLLSDALNAIHESAQTATDPKPVYVPGKYESPIEDRFAWHITKYLKQDVKFYAQFPIVTICGRFRMDFLIECDGKRVGFECDGKNFHDPYRDMWRDAMILGTGKVDSIFRLRGTDIYAYPLDLIYTIARWHSNFFSHRGQVNLLRLAKDSTVQSHIDKAATSHLIEIKDEEEGYHSFLEIDRRFRHTLPTHSYAWDDFYKYALDIGGGNLDGVMKSFEHRSN